MTRRFKRECAAEASIASLWLDGHQASSMVNGTPGNDALTGTDADDFFYLADGGRDVVSARGGSDAAYFGDKLARGDRFDGGEGNDFLQLSGDYDGLRITGRMLSGVENFVLSRFGNYDLVLSRASVDDVASLKIGNDGAASLALNAAAVRTGISCELTSGSDVVLLGAGNDYVSLGNGAKGSNGGEDVIDGGAGHNRISFFDVAAGVTFDLRVERAQTFGGQVLTLRNFDDVSGSARADAITGSDADNWLAGGGGDDTIDGLGGDDLISVGMAFDRITPKAVTVAGGTGFDTLDIDPNGFATAGATISLAESEYQKTGQGTIRLSGVEAITGTRYADHFTGNTFANALYGAEGADVLDGGSGDDRLYGDAYRTILIMAGFDGEAETLVDDDTAFADTLRGDAGDDQLFGNAGDDLLEGGTGRDILAGGLGNDRFLFTALADSSRRAIDTIADFTSGDRIDVSAIDADERTAGDQAFHLGTTPNRAGDIIVSFDAVASTTVVQLFVDGDATADMTINLVGNVALTAADFVL